MLDTEMEGSNLDWKEKEVGNHWGIVINVTFMAQIMHGNLNLDKVAI
jgi:hypothetical protein